MDVLRIDRELSRQSAYAEQLPPAPRHPALQGAARCDVAVVGGGLAGLSAAIELADRGFAVTLLEAGRIGGGASGRNGGQVIHGLACEIDTIAQQLGDAAAREVFAATLAAIDLIHRRCRRFDIDCGWRPGWLGVATSARKARALWQGAERLARQHAYPLTRIERAELPRWIESPRYHGAVHDPRSGHLQPLAYTRGLAQGAARLGVRLHEDSPVTALQAEPPAPGGRAPAGHTLRTPQGQLRATQVLLAGNVQLAAWAPGLAPALARRIMPVGTYVIATEPVDPALAARLIPDGSAVCDNDLVLDYYRFAAPLRTAPGSAAGPGAAAEGPRMVFGGRVSYSTATPPRLTASMRQRMVAALPALRGVAVSHTWGGFVDITLNRAPDFGRLVAQPDGRLRPLAPGEPAPASGGLYHLQGFSGHGLALSGLAGQLVAQAMAGDAGAFDTFARLRHRPFPGGAALRTPLLVAGMAWYRLKEALGG